MAAGGNNNPSFPAATIKPNGMPMADPSLTHTSVNAPHPIAVAKSAMSDGQSNNSGSNHEHTGAPSISDLEELIDRGIVRSYQSHKRKFGGETSPESSPEIEEPPLKRPIAGKSSDSIMNFPQQRRDELVEALLWNAMEEKVNFIQRKKSGKLQKTKEKRLGKKLDKQLKTGLSRVEGKKPMPFIEDVPDEDEDGDDGDIVMRSANY
jgi:hypothetical protein